MSTQTKTFHNTTSKTINVIGIGEVLAGEQISVTGEYLPPVNLANYPGLTETTDDEVSVVGHKPKKEAKDE